MRHGARRARGSDQHRRKAACTSSSRRRRTPRSRMESPRRSRNVRPTMAWIRLSADTRARTAEGAGLWQATTRPCLKEGQLRRSRKRAAAVDRAAAARILARLHVQQLQPRLRSCVDPTRQMTPSGSPPPALPTTTGSSARPTTATFPPSLARSPSAPTHLRSGCVGPKGRRWTWQSDGQCRLPRTRQSCRIGRNKSWSKVCCRVKAGRVPGVGG